MIQRVLALVALSLAASTVNAQFVNGQILTAQQLNSAFANVLPLTGGTLTGPLVVPTITASGGSISGVSISNPTLSNVTVTGSFTATGLVTNADLATQATNTVLANATAATASPTAFSMPSCSSSSSALQWTSNTGFTCYANSASLTGATFTGASGVSYSGAAWTINDTSGTGFAQLNYQKAGSLYWAWANNSSSNTFSLNRFNAGVFTDSPISVSPSTGLVTIADGATLTGSSGLSYGNASFFVNDTSGSNGSHYLLRSNSTTQWDLHSTSSTNGLSFDRYSSGTFVDTPISVNGSTGLVTFADGITSSGTNSIAGYAPLASPTFTGTVTTAALTASGLVTPSSTIGIKGTATNDSAQAGSIGEYNTVTTTATSITTATATNITSVSLAAGDYDVSGDICFNPAASTVTTQVIAAINTTSAAIPSAPDLTSINTTFSTGAGACIPTPVTRESLSTTTTVYLVGQTTFSASTMQTIGRLRWRRIR